MTTIERTVKSQPSILSKRPLAVRQFPLLLLLGGLVIAGLLVFTAVSQRTSLIGRTPLDQPPDVLVNRAQTIVASLGYTDAPGDTEPEPTTDQPGTNP